MSRNLCGYWQGDKQSDLVRERLGMLYLNRIQGGRACRLCLPETGANRKLERAGRVAEEGPQAARKVHRLI